MNDSCTVTALSPTHKVIAARMTEATRTIPPFRLATDIGCAKLRVVVLPERETRIATVWWVTLSVDHRAVDGATAATFLSTLRHRIEQPGHLLPAKENY